MSAIAKQFGTYQEDSIDCCSVSVRECFTNAKDEFCKVFLKACVVKILLEGLSKRSLKHLVQQVKFQVPRFGCAAGGIKFLFMLVMCFLQRTVKKHDLKVKRKYQVLLAALFSAISAIVGFNERELSLIKLFLFPLVCRCLWYKAFDLGVP